LPSIYTISGKKRGMKGNIFTPHKERRRSKERESFPKESIPPGTGRGRKTEKEKPASLGKRKLTGLHLKRRAGAARKKRVFTRNTASPSVTVQGKGENFNGGEKAFVHAPEDRRAAWGRKKPLAKEDLTGGFYGFAKGKVRAIFIAER